MNYQVIIVGAGPAGLSATLAAQESGLRYVTLEQDSWVARWHISRAARSS